MTTDLVTDLAESEGKTAITVLIDRLTKMIHMVPYTKQVTRSQYARLFMSKVFQLHGMPKVIICDRDPGFVSKLWDELFFLLGTDLLFNTTFHPQTDEQSEVTIRVLENFYAHTLKIVHLSRSKNFHL